MYDLYISRRHTSLSSYFSDRMHKTDKIQPEEEISYLCLRVALYL